MKIVAVAIITAVILYLTTLFAPSAAYPREGITPRAAKPETMPHMAKRLGWPEHWRTWLRIGVCEQPKPGTDLYYIRTDRDRYNAIYWKNPGSRFPGGLGFRPYNWIEFRPHSARHIRRMNLATPTQQLWAAERLFRWAERNFPRAGQTAWECHTRIAMGDRFGWYGFNPDGSWR